MQTSTESKKVTNVQNEAKTFPVPIPCIFTDNGLMEKKVDQKRRILLLDVHSEKYTTSKRKRNAEKGPY